MVTTIQRWGNSQGVRLPKIILESMSLRENDQVEITVFNDSIVIKKNGAKTRREKKS
jgi:antitoxin MazE